MSAKKILLSLVFIAVLGIYIIYQRGSSSNNPILNNNNSVSGLSATNQNQNQNTVPQNAGTMMGGNAGQMMPGRYKDGQYTGSSANAFYGMVQVKAIIIGGRLTDIQFLNYPQDNRNSLSRSNYALPQLKSEAIQAQSANVNAISGATETSSGFIQSLSSALSQAS